MPFHRKNTRKHFKKRRQNPGQLCRSIVEDVHTFARTYDVAYVNLKFAAGLTFVTDAGGGAQALQILSDGEGNGSTFIINVGGVANDTYGMLQLGIVPQYVDLWSEMILLFDQVRMKKAYVQFMAQEPLPVGFNGSNTIGPFSAMRQFNPEGDLYPTFNQQYWEALAQAKDNKIFNPYHDHVFPMFPAVSIDVQNNGPSPGTQVVPMTKFHPWMQTAGISSPASYPTHYGLNLAFQVGGGGAGTANYMRFRLIVSVILQGRRCNGFSNLIPTGHLPRFPGSHFQPPVPTDL